MSGNPAATAVKVVMKPSSITGASKTSLKYSYVCSPTTRNSELTNESIFSSTSTLTLYKIPGQSLCYDFGYLDGSNNPIGYRSTVQVLQ